MSDKLTVTVADDDPMTLIVDGQIDAHTAPDVDEALAGVPGDGPIRVVLSAVTFIDSSGLRVLVRAAKRQTGSGGSLALVEPSEPVRRLLEITGLTSELTVVE